MYKLKSFIEYENLRWELLSRNPLAIDLIEKNPDKVVEWSLCANPNAIHLLYKSIKIKENNKIEIDWQLFSKNEGAIHLLEQNLDKVDWQYLSANPNAIHILEQHSDKINWASLSGNPNAIHLLEQNLDKIDWIILSENPSAGDLLRQHPEKIVMHFFCRNPNPKVVSFLEELDKSKEWGDIIDWGVITSNPNALHIIEKNLDKVKSGIYNMSRYPNNICFLEKNPHLIDWWSISMNPGIFELDYEALKIRTSVYKEELIASALHPRRIQKLLEMSGENGDINDFI